MSLIYESASWIFTSLLIVIPAICLSCGILWLIRKRIPHTTLQKSHDVIGFTLGIVGVLYSVILGFTVINAQSRYNDAIQNIHSEALTLSDLYRDAGIFPDASRDQIRSSLRNYVEYVIKEEWWLPEQKSFETKTKKILEALWESYYQVDVSDAKVNVWYSVSIEKLNKLIEIRLARKFSLVEHLGPMMWTLLISGAIITIGFLFFFGLENFRSQLFMIAIIVGYLTFMLYLVYTLDHVFHGPGGIKPVALEQVYEMWQ